MKTYLAPAALFTLCSAAAFAFEPVSATVRVSGGRLYDYVLLGQHPKATDGFDNAYDTISPGNLNAAMGEPYLSVVVKQPGWKPAFRELRGDVRLPGKRQEYRLAVTSSLPKGTPLKLLLVEEESALPEGARLRLKVEGEKGEVELGRDACRLAAPGPGSGTGILVTVEQP